MPVFNDDHDLDYAMDSAEEMAFQEEFKVWLDHYPSREEMR